MKPILEILLAIKLFSLWAVLISIDMGLIVSKETNMWLHKKGERLHVYIQEELDRNDDIIT